MKRALLAGLAVAAMATAFPVTASATGTTTPTVPADCWVDFATGPSRATHSDPANVAVYDGPDCSEVAGVCVTVDYREPGPSRATHSRPAQPEPCVPLGEACAITVSYWEYANGGPARPAHQVSAPARPRGLSGGVVDIPPACEELMVLALTPTGSDTAPTIWIATAFLGAGAVLIIAPRRLARR